MTEEGKVYVIFNEMYGFYGPDVYKIGRTRDMDGRISGYCTPYIEPSEIMHLTDLVDDAPLLETVVFQKLNYCRMKDDREFFCEKIDVIKKIINETVSYVKYVST